MMDFNPYRKFGLPLFLILNTALFAVVFGSRLADPDGFLFANAYDALKNYYNYIFYTEVQSQGGYLDYFGMNFPYQDYVFYTDSTPTISWLSKMLGLKEGALDFYNLIFLANFLISPVVAYKIGEILKFHYVINICSALFVVWLNPMVLNLAAWTNLSLSLFFLLSIYAFIVFVKSEFKSIKTVFTLMGIFLLVILASLTHLYYLPMLLFLLGPAFVILFFLDYKSKSIAGLTSLLLAFVFVYLFLRLSDGVYNLRPEDTLGFNSHEWTCTLGDYFKSYNFLSFPAFKEQSNWNLERLTFLGSAFPFFLLFLCGILVFVKRQKLILEDDVKIKSIVLSLLAGCLVCYFTSVGTQLNLFIGKINIYNFLNPLNIASEFSDTAKNFRCMSRFSLPFFTGIILLSFYVLDRGTKVLARKKLQWLLAGLIMVICYFDIYQMAKFASNDFKSENYFSEKSLESIPLIDNTFDAILPIPYYHVGSEKLGYIIDDTNEWSRFTYQLAIKNKRPLMSSKMSRTPISYAQNQLSFFQGNTDSEFLKLLKGKRILICESKTFKSPEMKDEPAKTIAANPKYFIEKWQPQFLKTVGDVNYYILEF